MSAIQIAEYRPDRMGMIFINHGESDIYISADKSDVEDATPFGIKLEQGIPFPMPWIFYGEIITLVWWAECTRYKITVYEWWGNCQVIPNPNTPFHTPCDRKVIVNDCVKPKITHCDPKRRPDFCPALHKLISRLRGKVIDNDEDKEKIGFTTGGSGIGVPKGNIGSESEKGGDSNNGITKWKDII